MSILYVSFLQGANAKRPRSFPFCLTVNKSSRICNVSQPLNSLSTLSIWMTLSFSVLHLFFSFFFFLFCSWSSPAKDEVNLCGASWQRWLIYRKIFGVMLTNNKNIDRVWLKPYKNIYIYIFFFNVVPSSEETTFWPSKIYILQDCNTLLWFFND